MTQNIFVCRYCGTDLAHRDDVTLGDELTCSECDAIYEVFSDHEEYGSPQVEVTCKECGSEHTVELEEGETISAVTCPDCDTDHSFRDDMVAVDPDKGHPKFEKSVRLAARPRGEL